MSTVAARRPALTRKRMRGLALIHEHEMIDRARLDQRHAAGLFRLVDGVEDAAAVRAALQYLADLAEYVREAGDDAEGEPEDRLAGCDVRADEPDEAVPAVTEITLTLPPIDAVCQPNARVHEIKRGKARGRQRDLVHGLVLEAISPKRPEHVEAVVHVTVVPKTRRRRDPTNVQAALKGAIDGLVQGGLLKDDDRVTFGDTVFAEPDPNDPRVELRVIAKG